MTLQQPKLEFLRLVTPLGIFLLTLFVSLLRSDIGNLRGDVKELDSKMFKHMTNDELHTPRSITITKPEFSIYQQLRDQQMSEMRQMMIEMRQYFRR